jgi:hypothetical protein
VFGNEINFLATAEAISVLNQCIKLQYFFGTQFTGTTFPKYITNRSSFQNVMFHYEYQTFDKVQNTSKPKYYKELYYIKISSSHSDLMQRRRLG